jgi:2'-5' RNA ligase
MEALDGARWIDEDNLHLTLRFVGEVERPAANDLAEALGRIESAALSRCASRASARSTAAGATSPMPTRCGRGCRSPNRSKACGRKSSARATSGLGRETRRFTPHITLARTRPRDRRSPAGSPPGAISRAGPWTVEEFILFESRLGHTGREVLR